MPTYQHDGLDLHYKLLGAGPPVLCVHGATGTGSYEWSKLGDALQQRYRFVIPDLRGHGLSDFRAGEMSIEAVNADLLALIAHERLEPPHLVAFSFGAEAALELELTFPGTAASLILLSPGLGDPKSSVPTRSQLEARWPQTLRALHAERHGDDHWLSVMLELCERAAARPKADLEAIAAMACPILLVLGSEDDPRRLRQAEVMQNAHARTEVVVIDRGRHAVHKDRPSEVAAVIDAFLARVTRCTPGPLVVR
jgi:pimeloyl-ACP methyl ester carboxylesterase